MYSSTVVQEMSRVQSVSWMCQPQTDLSYFCLWLIKALERWNKLNIRV